MQSSNPVNIRAYVQLLFSKKYLTNSSLKIIKDMFLENLKIKYIFIDYQKGHFMECPFHPGSDYPQQLNQNFHH